MIRTWSAIALVARTTGVATFAPETPHPRLRRRQRRERRRQHIRGSSPQLKVTVVLSRFQGDEKIGSLPYVFGLSGPGLRANLRIGVDVPVPRSTPEPKNPTLRHRATPIVRSERTLTARPARDQEVRILWPWSLRIPQSIWIQLRSLEPSWLQSPATSPHSDRSERAFRSWTGVGQTTQHTSATIPLRERSFGWMSRSM